LERLLETSDEARRGWQMGDHLERLEEKMCRNAAAGDPIELDGPFELADMEAWGKERTVRAEVLRHLLITDEWPADAKGIRLRGVRISGLLDLEAATLRCPLSLESCYLDASEPASFKYATASSVTLIGCRLAGVTGEALTARALTLSRSTLTGPLRLAGVSVSGTLRCSGTQLTCHDEDGYALSASRMKVGGDVFLDEGFTAAGAIELGSADIAGELKCSGARLTGKDDEDGYALSAALMKVGADVLLDEEFAAAGAIELGSADIAGELSCDGARLTGCDGDGYALSAFGMRVGGDVFLGGKFAAAGAIELDSADIAGELRCRGVELTGCDGDGYALSASRMRVGGDVFLGGKFAAVGAIELASAEVAGELSCSGVELTGCDGDGYALSASRMKVGGDVFLGGKFAAVGAIELASADIAGSLRCSGVELTGRDGDGYSLSASGVKVREDVYLGGKFTAVGAIELDSADIAGELSCSGVELTGRDGDGYSLSASGVTVGGDVHFGDSFAVNGGISLVSARLRGSLEMMPTRLTVNEQDADQEAVSLDASHAQITAALNWLPAEQVRGRVNLQGATAGELVDDWASGNGRKNGHWPIGGQLSLDGFTYSSLGQYERTNVDQRLEWLRSQYRLSSTGWLGFATQPYEQLAAVYQHAGQDVQARKVAIARRTDLRKYGNLNASRRAGNWLLDTTIKYGYQAWRAAFGLVIVFAAFLVVAVVAQHHHAIVPVGNLVGVHPLPVATRCTSSYPCFYPAGYAIDVAIPLINVHQADNWGFDGHSPGGWIWVASSWAATGLGWALVTLLVAGYTGLVRKQ
jgi:hypothetical protein